MTCSCLLLTTLNFLQVKNNLVVAWDTLHKEEKRISVSCMYGVYDLVPLRSTFCMFNENLGG